VSHAATARIGWIDTSSLPPKPPPQAVGTMRTAVMGTPSTRATSSWSMTGAWVQAVTSIRSPTRRAKPASGSI
jgi:hypothetical protein